MKKYLITSLTFLFLKDLAVAASLTFPGSQLSSEVISPHTAWAKPWFAGATRILAITAATSGREVIELSQRLEAEIIAVPIPEEKRYLSEVWNYLREKLSQPYDLLLAGSLRWVDLPEDIRQTILEKVKNGTNFLFVDPQGLDRTLFEVFESGRTSQVTSDAPFLIPFEKLPAFSRFRTPEEILSRYVSESVLGKGRLCFLSYASGRGEHLFLTPSVASNQVEYDYYCALVIRTILSLAGKLSVERIREMRVEGNRLAVQSSLVKPGEVILRIRCHSGEIEYQRKFIQVGKALSVPLPYLPPGIHFLDVFLLREKANLDWRSSFLEVPTGGQISISLQKEAYQPGEIISGQVSVSGVSDGMLKLTLLDSWDRVIETKGLIGRNLYSFSFQKFLPVAILHRLRAELVQGNQVLLAQEKSFPIALRFDPKEFFFLVWGGPAREYLPRYLLKLVTQAGVDGLFCRCDDPETLREITSHNLYANPYIFSLKTASRTKELARQPCFSSQSFRDEMVRSLRQKAAIVAPFAPITYGLGDENELSHWSANIDFCFSPYCLADLREYLKKEYKSLEALNSEWQTSFGSWEEVRPVTLKQLEEREEKRNFSAWIDHRLHMESVFAGIHLLGRQTIEQVDPVAKVGAEGIWGEGNSFTGIDYTKMAEALRSVGGYGGTWLWRNFLTADSLLWDWGIYSSSVEKGARYPWEVLLAGGNGVGFFSLYSSEPDYTAFLPDYTFHQPFSVVARETKKIKEGIGRLLLSAKAEYSPVALVHSQPNLHLTTAISGRTTFDYLKSRSCFLKFLQRLGYYPGAISHREIASGGLRKTKYRFLFLPSLFCLSPEERSELRQFVEKGGVVVSDSLPGLFDGHGKITDNSDIETLFGVSRSQWPGIPDQPLIIGESSLSISCAEKLRVTNGQPHLTSAGGYPALIVRKLGKGQAVCLNILLPTLDNLKLDDQRVFLSFLQGFWQKLGMNPQFEVTEKESGQPFYGGTGRFFTSGNNRYLFVLSERTGRVKVRWPEKSHVYEIISSTYHGWLEEFSTEFGRAEPLLLACLPYLVRRLEVKGPVIVPVGTIWDGQLQLEVTNGTPGFHVVNLKVFNPKGELVPYLSKNLDCPAGQASFQIPFCLNADLGQWKIQAKDVASGVKAEISFRLIEQRKQ
ncbi:MAG: beta-galactosidase [Candidatus Omnitrophica bacterium]|nr:beta-galactosidase [Candidatus Omnitrophota bacterium]